MKKTLVLGERDQRMLELLARGGSAKDVARVMGYTFGSMRVYLHHMYRRIGVTDKLGAVLWFQKRLAPAGSPRPAGSARMAIEPARGESFGDVALRAGLGAALGFMGSLLGGYGRLWEVAARLKGDKMAESAEVEARRALARAIWEAYLREDIAYARAAAGADASAGPIAKAPSLAVPLVLLLHLGGDGDDANRLVTRIASKKGSGPSLLASELALMHAFRDALKGAGVEALAKVHAIAAEQSANLALKHAAIVALYYAYRTRGDVERARNVANALWAEAEGTRQHLEEMGERPLLLSAALPALPQEKASRPAKEAPRRRATARAR